MRKHLVATTLALPAAVTLLAGCGGLIGPEHTTKDSLRPTGTVRTIEIHSGSGTVRVTPGDKVVVRRTVRYNGDEAGTLKEPVDGTLTLDNCDRCSTDYTVTAPSGTVLRVQSGSGDVHIGEFTGSVRLEAGSGDIDAKSLGGTAELRTGSGSITAVFTGPVPDITANAGSGDVDLTLPRGSYLIDADSKSGSRNIDVPQQGSDTHRVRIRTGSGDIKVRAAA
ncbi:DUF4097 family beta strand repeat-containing protein [Streptomyces sp. NPDC051020]|uniref:DUF4097 family beta strand repeat-containing protein n=1 Tax=Streptomyces sp. NPDC051020 TaxID=3155409 RepID=UPI003447A10C